MSIKLLLFFIFFFFSEQWFSANKNIKIIHNYLKALEQTIQTVNEKNPNLLDPVEKSVVSCVLELNKYLLYYKKKDLEDYLKKNLSKTWMDFFQDKILEPAVKAINKKDTKNLEKLFESINKDSFKKQIEAMMESPSNTHNSRELWRYYQCILLKIFIADFFKAEIDLSLEETKDHLNMFFPFDINYLTLIIMYLVYHKKKESLLHGNRDTFLDNYLVKNIIDWKTILNKNISIDNQPKFSPMDNDTFLQTFKDSPFSSSQPHISKIKINGPMEKLIIPDKQSKKKSYIITWQWLIFIISAGIILISPFFNKKKKTTNPNKLIKSLEIKISQISFELNQLKQKNQRILMANP